MTYKFNEDQLLEELKQYIDSTYKGHYTGGNQDEVQTFELISKRPLRGLYFALGNVSKYADRYGEKEGFKRDDLVKTLHYALWALYSHDKMMKKENE